MAFELHLNFHLNKTMLSRGQWVNVQVVCKLKHVTWFRYQYTCQGCPGFFWEPPLKVYGAPGNIQINLMECKKCATVFYHCYSCINCFCYFLFFCTTCNFCWFHNLNLSLCNRQEAHKSSMISCSLCSWLDVCSVVTKSAAFLPN